ncbi:unnamed protein product [Lactuca virosa]|uniref:Uncharacterized protein n=1 Tax=Lactuca virosa TaxID=75947 RepID=A0AAU9LYQ7_9ASTR|nr:unnamed protein product [Lactuca virosa]
MTSNNEEPGSDFFYNGPGYEHMHEHESESESEHEPEPESPNLQTTIIQVHRVDQMMQIRMAHIDHLSRERGTSLGHKKSIRNHITKPYSKKYGDDPTQHNVNDLELWTQRRLVRKGGKQKSPIYAAGSSNLHFLMTGAYSFWSTSFVDAFAKSQQEVMVRPTVMIHSESVSIFALAFIFSFLILCFPRRPSVPSLLFNYPPLSLDRFPSNLSDYQKTLASCTGNRRSCLQDRSSTALVQLPPCYSFNFVSVHYFRLRGKQFQQFRVLIVAVYPLLPCTLHICWLHKNLSLAFVTAIHDICASLAGIADVDAFSVLKRMPKMPFSGNLLFTYCLNQELVQ